MNETLLSIEDDRAMNMVDEMDFENSTTIPQEFYQVKDYLLNNTLAIREKMDENDGDLLRMNMNLNETMGRMNKLAERNQNMESIVHQFRQSLIEAVNDIKMIKMNTTANLASFDKTTELVLVLFNEMSEFNGDISDRVGSIEKLFPPLNSTEEYLGEYYDELDGGDTIQ